MNIYRKLKDPKQLQFGQYTAGQPQMSWISWINARIL